MAEMRSVRCVVTGVVCAILLIADRAIGADPDADVSLPARFLPMQAAVAPNGEALCAVDWLSKKLVVIRRAAKAVPVTIPTPVLFPESVSFSNDAAVLVVSGYDMRRAVVTQIVSADTGDDLLADRFMKEGKLASSSTVVSTDGSSIVVLDRSKPELVFLNPRSGARTGRSDIVGDPIRVLSVDGNRVLLEKSRGVVALFLMKEQKYLWESAIGDANDKEESARRVSVRLIGESTSARRILLAVSGLPMPTAGHAAVVLDSRDGSEAWRTDMASGDLSFLATSIDRVGVVRAKCIELFEVESGKPAGATAEEPASAMTSPFFSVAVTATTLWMGRLGMLQPIDLRELKASVK
jgi:hypothetical protein